MGRRSRRRHPLAMAWRTGGCAGRCLLPLVLLAASLLDWSLISLVNMIFFFAIRFVAPRRGFRAWRLYLLFWCTIVYSVLASLAQVTFHLIWCIEGEGWVVAHSWWAKLVGFARYLNLYIAVGLVDFICMHVHVFALIHWYVSYKTNHVS